MSRFTILSPAKVNLNLRIEGIRPDGFHEIRSVVQPIDIFDTVSVRVVEGEGVSVRCKPACVPPEENTAAVAARLFFKESAIKKGARIEIKKTIPSGAGLGGGSGNAAAVLTGLNRTLRVFGNEDLMRLGSAVGSDVPLFFADGACEVRGAGEKVEPLGGLPLFHYVVCFPGYGLSTADVYGKWDEFRSGAPDEVWGTETPLEAGNDLERSALFLNPELARFRNLIEEKGGTRFRMTGSGSAFFSLFDSPGSARAVFEAVSGGERFQCFLARALRRTFVCVV